MLSQNYENLKLFRMLTFKFYMPKKVSTTFYIHLHFNRIESDVKIYKLPGLIALHLRRRISNLSIFLKKTKFANGPLKNGFANIFFIRTYVCLGVEGMGRKE